MGSNNILVFFIALAAAIATPLASAEPAPDPLKEISAAPPNTKDPTPMDSALAQLRKKRPEGSLSQLNQALMVCDPAQKDACLAGVRAGLSGSQIPVEFAAMLPQNTWENRKDCAATSNPGACEKALAMSLPLLGDAIAIDEMSFKHKPSKESDCKESYSNGFKAGKEQCKKQELLFDAQCVSEKIDKEKWPGCWYLGFKKALEFGRCDASLKPAKTSTTQAQKISDYKASKTGGLTGTPADESGQSTEAISPQQ